MPTKIRMSILGVGNVASTLVQGIQFYGKGSSEEDGLWHKSVGGYAVSDIEIVSAFDIDAKKTGIDLSDSIFRGGTRKHVDVDRARVEVRPGIIEDEISARLRNAMKVESEDRASIVRELKRSEPDIVLNLISSSMENSSRRYAECALDANVDFLNATPAPVARSDLKARFLDSKLLIVGDDLMSQLGGTAFHRGMMDFLVHRGVKIRNSYQLDVGGSMDTQNTLDEKVRAVKRAVKTSSINYEVPYEFDSVAGTTEYADFLEDTRLSYYWMYGDGFMKSPAVLDITLRTDDGANACNILLDVVRAMKYCKEKGDLSLGDVISSYGFKNPPNKAKIRDASDNFTNSFEVISRRTGLR